MKIKNNKNESLEMGNLGFFVNWIGQVCGKQQISGEYHCRKMDFSSSSDQIINDQPGIKLENDQFYSQMQSMQAQEHLNQHHQSLSHYNFAQNSHLPTNPLQNGQEVKKQHDKEEFVKGIEVPAIKSELKLENAEGNLQISSIIDPLKKEQPNFTPKSPNLPQDQPQISPFPEQYPSPPVQYRRSRYRWPYKGFLNTTKLIILKFLRTRHPLIYDTNQTVRQLVSCRRKTNRYQFQMMIDDPVLYPLMLEMFRTRYHMLECQNCRMKLSKHRQFHTRIVILEKSFIMKRVSNLTTDY